MRSYGFLRPPPSGDRVDFPAGDEPCVLASLSTTQQNQSDLLASIVEALADLPVRALVTTGGVVSPGALPAPANVAVTNFADHAYALANAAVMVTHAGLGSTAAALGAGVPLVCAPIARDQPLNARRAADLGAAIVVDTFEPRDIAAAVSEAIAAPAYTEAARRIARASDAEGGPGRAARDIGGLLT